MRFGRLVSASTILPSVMSDWDPAMRIARRPDRARPARARAPTETSRSCGGCGARSRSTAWRPPDVAEVAFDGRQVLRMDALEPFLRPAADLVLVVSDDGLPPVREVDVAGRELPVPQAVVRRAGHQVVPLLALARNRSLVVSSSSELRSIDRSIIVRSPSKFRYASSTIWRNDFHGSTSVSIAARRRLIWRWSRL